MIYNNAHKVPLDESKAKHPLHTTEKLQLASRIKYRNQKFFPVCNLSTTIARRDSIDLKDETSNKIMS